MAKIARVLTEKSRAPRWSRARSEQGVRGDGNQESKEANSGGSTHLVRKNTGSNKCGREEPLGVVGCEEDGTREVSTPGSFAAHTRDTLTQ